MKLLLIIFLLISVNANADWLIKWGDYEKTKPTEQEALDYLEKVILKSKWMECDWQLDQTGTYAEKVFNEYNEETSKFEQITKYCLPSNFTVTPPRDLENNPTPDETEKKNKILACDALKTKLASEDLKLDELNALKRCELGL